MSRALFITGTGTDIGKTYVTGLIVKKLAEHKKNPGYYKAAMSGNARRPDGSLIPGDALFVQQCSGISQPLEEMCPYVYENAYSPHLASRIEGNPVVMDVVKQGFYSVSRMYDISFLQRAKELCTQYDVLLIFDEVATGFGRTGNRFVADLVLPDILVLGKALTGGYIGHAVTVANHKVYQAFYSDDDRHALMHGPTFMGNALACAVALKGIEIFERENYMDKIRRIEEISHREMDGFSDPRIREIRIMGGCTCIEVHDSKTLEGFQQFAYERGVFSRPFLKYMYAMVPYIIEEKELVKIFNTMKAWFLK
ncbi:MAG: aminotransferase class III-fold pyridoxal phosphate-dependent enzyme [Eubacterium sp.]|nr:aminotransferase class III-fold pyridoxal phosphate-dependent enzyme [Eubacterium sp.]